MQIWVDADACPVVIKDILYKAAKRKSVTTIFVANHALRLPPSPWLKSQVVSAGFDSADNEIVKQIQAGDLLVTADIPLAAEALEKKAFVISPRGEIYSDNTIRQRLTMRDFMETMRASGEHSGGPAPLSQRDRHAFASALDSLLQKALG